MGKDRLQILERRFALACVCVCVRASLCTGKRACSAAPPSHWDCKRDGEAAAMLPARAPMLTAAHHHTCPQHACMLALQRPQACASHTTRWLARIGGLCTLFAICVRGSANAHTLLCIQVTAPARAPNSAFQQHHLRAHTILHSSNTTRAHTHLCIPGTAPARSPSFAYQRHHPRAYPPCHLCQG